MLWLSVWASPHRSLGNEVKLQTSCLESLRFSRLEKSLQPRMEALVPVFSTRKKGQRKRSSELSGRALEYTTRHISPIISCHGLELTVSQTGKCPPALLSLRSCGRRQCIWGLNKSLGGTRTSLFNSKIMK